MGKYVMNGLVGIRREDKNRFESRVPLIPNDIAALMRQTGARFIVQPSKIRVFSDAEYQRMGAEINEDISSCPLVFAVKEIPLEYFRRNGTYAFFSHTIKGQPKNMPMLKKMMELKCNLIDYEKIIDAQNRRLVFFGKFAGLAGMIDTLWAYGQRVKAEGIENPFTRIDHTHRYENLTDAEEHIREVGEKIIDEGLPEILCPLIAGFAGYGNVSRGAQEIYDQLPVKEIAPQSISQLFKEPKAHRHNVYKVVFKEEDLVKPVGSCCKFELQDYYTHPEKYVSQFDYYTPMLSILVNCIYWEPRYPRIVTKKFATQLYSHNVNARPKVIGDISCDLDGAIELTIKTTEPDKPVFLYDIDLGEAVDGFKGNGPVIMAVDNLPCELPQEASKEFSRVLTGLVPSIINADFSKPLARTGLPEELQRATILMHGQFTPNFQFMEKFL